MKFPKASLFAALTFAMLFPAQFLWAGTSASFAITNSWATGYNGEITITNHRPAAVNGWTLEFDFPGTMTNSWNGSVTSNVGARYVVREGGYNAGIAANASVTFGFTANPATAAEPPVNFLANGGNAGGGGATLEISTTSLPVAALRIPWC